MCSSDLEVFKVLKSNSTKPCPCRSNILSTNIGKMIVQHGVENDYGQLEIEIENRKFQAGMASFEILREFVKEYIAVLKSLVQLMMVRREYADKVFLRTCDPYNCPTILLGDPDDEEDVKSMCKVCREYMQQNLIVITTSIECKIQRLRYFT